MNEETKQPQEFRIRGYKDKIVLDRSIYEAFLDIANKQNGEEALRFLQDILFYAFCPELGIDTGDLKLALAKAIIDNDNKNL